MADNSKEASMHPDFPRWYREVNLDENRDRIARRWLGVAEIIADTDTANTEALLRVVYHARTGASAESLQRIREYFKHADDLFYMQDNQRELEILCGAALAAILEGRSDSVAGTALAVTTANMDGVRVAKLPFDLHTLAESAIEKLAESQRRRPQRPQLGFKKAKASLSQLDTTTLSNAFDLMAEAINSVFTSTDRFIAIQDEELNMLWWILNERSDNLQMTFGKIPSKALPLVLASELAGMTEFSPGPRSVCIGSA